MKYLRYLLVALGLAVFGAAVLVGLGSGASELTDTLLAAAGNDYVLVGSFGVAALLVTIVALLVRGFRGLDQATPPDPSTVRTAPRPGSGFDRAVDDSVGLSAWLSGDDADAVRERLREAAIRTEMRESGVSRQRAREAVESGEWTDDRVAAALVGSEGPSPDWHGRVEAALRGESWFQYGARRTARAIGRSEEGGGGR